MDETRASAVADTISPHPLSKLIGLVCDCALEPDRSKNAAEIRPRVSSVSSGLRAVAVQSIGSKLSLDPTEEPMKSINLSLIAASATAIVLIALPFGAAFAQQIEKKGTTPYVTHFIFRPVSSIDIPGLGTATNLEAVGTTQNTKGEKMLDKMSAHCAALSVASGDKKYIDGACVLADNDGDKIFSTFDTRDVDKSQAELSCGTHVITGGTGKYTGITGREPFGCNEMPALAGPGGYAAMDIPHNTTWEIK